MSDPCVNVVELGVEMASRYRHGSGSFLTDDTCKASGDPVCYFDIVYYTVCKPVAYPTLDDFDSDSAIVTICIHTDEDMVSSFAHNMTAWYFVV